MNRLISATPKPPLARPTRSGYTLVEILTATALSAMLMLGVVEVFSQVADSVSRSRATLETSDRLRAAATRLQMDLAGVTVTMRPPRRVADDEGYFEYLEGPIGPVQLPSSVAKDSEGNDDTTVGDFDDVLMFTARSSGEPFVGRCAGGSIESAVAEIAWFLRGNTLYRRVLLVAPGVGNLPQAQFYANNDISARPLGTAMVPNTLGDLTRRECRFAHHPTMFPFDMRGWGKRRLPSLRECSDAGWNAGNMPPTDSINWNPAGADLWSQQPFDSSTCDALTGDVLSGSRIGEDIILTSVIGFDVKAWDPQANSGTGAYVDLGYGGSASSHFDHAGHPNSGLSGGLARVYDTWSWHYECDGVDQDGIAGADQGTNGFDNDDATPTVDENDDGDPTNDGIGVVDDIAERETMPPYPVPLRGIQVKIRVFEPDSRTVREVTVVQDFLPK